MSTDLVELLPFRKVPTIVSILCQFHGAWVVGSAAWEDTPTGEKDFDVIVPPSQWRSAATLIPKDAKPNTFGGWKFSQDGRWIDVWPDNISMMLNHPMTKKVWNPALGIRFVKEEAPKGQS